MKLKISLIQMKWLNYLNDTYSKAVIYGSTIASLMFNVGYYVRDYQWKRHLTDKGYGEYNIKTGTWSLVEPEIVLLNVKDPIARLDNKGLTIKDYLSKLESELNNNTKLLLEQEKILLNYEKKLGISQKNSSFIDKNDQSLVLTK